MLLQYVISISTRRITHICNEKDLYRNPNRESKIKTRSKNFLRKWENRPRPFPSELWWSGYKQAPNWSWLYYEKHCMKSSIVGAGKVLQKYIATFMSNSIIIIHWVKVQKVLRETFIFCSFQIWKFALCIQASISTFWTNNFKRMKMYLLPQWNY